MNKIFTFPYLFYNTLKQFPDKDALTFVNKKALTYNDVNNQIKLLISQLKSFGINKDDKVAILSSNMPNWGIVYFASTFIGAVSVPILPDFSESEIDNILNHSESKVIYVSKSLYSKIKNIKNRYLKKIIAIEDFSVLVSFEEIIYENNYVYSYDDNLVNEDDLATIIYTSGTTGKSKGVMLTHKNICFTAEKSGIVQPINSNDRFLSILPLSHTYENTLGFVLPIMNGACVYYIEKPPTPAVLLPILKVVKPTVMLTVPLIIEKIYKNSILPKFNKHHLTKVLYSKSISRKLLNKIAGKKLYKTFGGNLKFFGVGGAKLDKTVEKFLFEAKFPYAIGYGLTETSPLIAGTNPKIVKPESTGPVIEEVSIKIVNKDFEKNEGEIWVKGPNVMKGYFKEPELTKEIITPDGWFKTGDLGYIDDKGFLFIKGRIKNLIIGASGENIYPEEIESVINEFKHVEESIVINKKGKLVAMVHFNLDDFEDKFETVKKEFTSKLDAKLELLKSELFIHINSKVSKFSRVQHIEIHKEPFVKTATKKIKKYLYEV